MHTRQLTALVMGILALQPAPLSTADLYAMAKAIVETVRTNIDEEGRFSDDPEFNADSIPRKRSRKRKA